MDQILIEKYDFDLTYSATLALLKAGLIYADDDGYRLQDGVTFDDLDVFCSMNGIS